MKKVTLTFLLLLLFITSHAQLDPRLRGITEKIEKILKATNTPGCAIALVEGDKVLYTQGFGYRDYENKIKADANTLFPIGSTTKAFTAALLGQLREKGALTFEESPKKYVPGLRFYNDQLNNSLLVQDLMSMRSGLALHDKAWSGFPVSDRDSLLRRIEYLEPFTPLRMKWNYSNFSYFVLGTITEKLTGKPWETNVEQALFKPLKMTSSTIGVKSLTERPNVALGYNFSNNRLEKVDYYDLSAMNSAGAINSTAQDMGNWLLTWVNKGRFNQEQVLPEKYVEEAMSPHVVMPKGYLAEEEFPAIYAASYGYGWIISDYKGHYRVEHGGSIDGFRATVAFFPNDKVGVVVLTNQTGYEAAMMIRNTLMDSMLGAKRTDWLNIYQKNRGVSPSEAKPLATSANPAPPAVLNPQELHQYVGTYANPGYGSIKLFSEDGSLYTYFRKRKVKIVPALPDTFHALSTVYPYKRVMPPLQFQKDKKGTISSLFIKFESDLKAIEFSRQ
ncbi:serine hydrolase [Rufibacter glacialis]|uniref:Serine hydrolase n=1 Tax=Rufibacter glacialis TaxID=1259555 RepID=A0A5M8QDF7_9BACT|nr:serine hydrolase [Rufibacter glacialis]KAA6432462.1 serine hydrolase [Rufibacter glacialis]GGK78869.1 penicillin-binding protein [Rufibacter glacialis]